MFFLIGFAVVIGSVLGGYLPHGSIAVLNQPLEVLIICGAAIGAFIIANPKTVLSKIGSHLGRVMKGPPHDQESYIELLTLLYTIFKTARSKGMLSLEAHIDAPDDSPLFQNFPKFLKNHHAVEFLTDYLRLLTMGSEDPMEMEDLMDKEIETHHEESHKISGAVTAMGDGLPAFGIVAAVLGIIVTMGSITEPPEVLGALVGAALVGTFLGILLAYGIVLPIGSNLSSYADAESKYFECIKASVLAHLKGAAPAVSVEYGRKVLFSDVRPNFIEIEAALDQAPSI